MGTGFRTRAVANGAAVQIDVLGDSLSFDISEDLARRLKEIVREHLDEGQRSFVLDMGRVTSVDSTGVGLLVNVHHQVAEAGGMLAVVGVQGEVLRILKMMRLDRFLSLFPDAERALSRMVERV